MTHFETTMFNSGLLVQAIASAAGAIFGTAGQIRKKYPLRRPSWPAVIAGVLTAVLALGAWCGNTLSAKSVENVARRSVWAVPEQYDAQECDQPGTVEELTYQTKAYATDGRDVEKKALVYLPYGYDESQSYNILYLMHGTGDDEEYWLRTHPRNKTMVDQMIARGDMGVEIPLEHVPIIQQRIIEKVYEAGKVVITATQMLDSMMIHPRPTRAETTDVANAIAQGTSAIMLSGETAAGKYPVEALKMMVKIAVHMERNIDYNAIFRRRERSEDPDITNAISHATCMTAIDLKANAILAVSKTGNTARMISKYRPECLIAGCSSSEKVYRQLNLSWGILPLQIREEYSSEILCLRAIEAAQTHGIVEEGDKIVFTGGIPLGIPGRTNLIRVCIVGE